MAARILSEAEERRRQEILREVRGELAAVPADVLAEADRIIMSADFKDMTGFSMRELLQDENLDKDDA